MKGLLLKDIYTLTKQMKLFIVILVLFSLVPGYSMAAFAICYSAMMPITALAYDERAKWDKLAAMMPYSASDIVISKYMLGSICALFATLLSLIGGIGYAVFKNTPVDDKALMILLPLLCIALIIQSINLPLMFKIGVEKGRILFVMITVVTVLGGVALSENLKTIPDFFQTNLLTVLLAGIAVTVFLCALSALISIKIYKNREA